MVIQVITTGSLNIGAARKTGAISGLTAGLTQAAVGAMNISKAGIGSLQVAVPSSTTAAQWQQIDAAIQYGASKGIKLKITVTK
ncbi:endonuclease toxin domain-containing protein [Cupriavidus plantarum]|uniref:endonuclease toxin domain-containing protein n=1 Tax=Cupriavidus plantarum TaxID=942865 RepID=UPI00339D9462